MKKYDFSMKKYDFFFCHPALLAVKDSPTFTRLFVKMRSGGQKSKQLQTFCKNAQWRAKKLRERGSNTARPTEKGGGGLPIGARLGRDSVANRRLPLVISCRFGRFRSRFCRDLACRSCRFRRDLACRSRRHPSRHPSRHHADTRADAEDKTPEPTQKTRHRRQDTEDKTQKTRHKKARFLNRGIGLQLSQGVARS